MKQLFLLLLLACFATSTVQAQNRPKVKAKRAFSHTSESSKGKTSKVHFRRETIRPVIDLKPNSLERSKTVKAPKAYKYSNGNKLKRAR
ncbi:hypothetical protein [Hymenobacter properus]|uniref:Uncharacterized protein n=1 Tax=Hymenobacter properus TaxID=2791026 RepID=A0A931BBQ4_9BACT|nr:hypothetical protein [Hymenobacter properus]MBF9140930.1 hypothetical protein [Hymenobacter properus]MBR7719739.1 hypothetical protein [Microvirga sp. SRT04]